MPQPKRSAQGRKADRAADRPARGRAHTSATGKGSTKRTGSAKGKGSTRTTGSPRSTGSAKRAGAPANAARGRSARRTPAANRDRRAAPSPSSAAVLRDLLARSVITPLNLVMLTSDRIQEAMEDAVERGRMTRDDANDLVLELVRRGRKQTEDVLSELEELIGRGREHIETAASGTARRATTTSRRAAARARQSQPTDRVIREVDRARRVTGLGPSFPILDYEGLTAAQINARLGDLTPAQLRKVRDYERRHGNRKTVLDGIEAKLA